MAEALGRWESTLWMISSLNSYHASQLGFSCDMMSMFCVYTVLFIIFISSPGMY